MKNRTDNHQDQAATHRSGDGEIRQMLEQAGRRPDIPSSDLRVIKAVARAEWQQLVESKRSRKRWWSLVTPLPAAAGILLVLALAWWWRAETGPPALEAIATIELFRGNVQLEEPDSADREPTPGRPLTSGVEIATGADRDPSASFVSVRLAGGQSVRLHSSTRARLLSISRIELLKGAVYVDSGSSLSGDASVEVSTPFGTVSDIGTQFEVRVGTAEETLRIRVRSGSISLDRGQQQFAAAVGEELTVRTDGSVTRGVYEISGTDWDWILSAAPTLDIEGLPLRAFLDWVAAETALEVHYEDAILAGSVGTINLHGTIEGLRPDEALVAVLPGTGLDHRIENGTLFIRRLPPGSGGV